MKQQVFNVKSKRYLAIGVPKDSNNFSVIFSGMLFFDRFQLGYKQKKFCYLTKSATGKKEIVGKLNDLDETELQQLVNQEFKNDEGHKSSFENILTMMGFDLQKENPLILKIL